MSKIVVSIMGAFVLLAATSASGMAQRTSATPTPPLAPAGNLTTQAPFTGPNQDQGPGGSRPLFNIGKLPVVVWSPVQPSYNSKGNGTVAANWPWTGDAY